jgi:hypothetical protein
MRVGPAFEIGKAVFYPVGELLIDVRVDPKAEVRIRLTSSASIKDNRSPKFAILHTTRQQDLSPASLTISAGNFRGDRRASRFLLTCLISTI